MGMAGIEILASQYCSLPKGINSEKSQPNLNNFIISMDKDSDRF